MNQLNSLNETIRTQLEHRTIREFKEQRIPKELMEQFFEVARRTATSTGMQACSIIRVTDPKLKKEIADICTQEYVARAPELLIFIVDQYRNYQIAKEKNVEAATAKSIDRFLSSFTDACLMAQNVVNAAESLGLGTVYLGSILNDSSKLCKILNLPELTFPVLGLAIGYPNQEPQLKPRMDMKLRVFENRYTCFDNYLEKIKDYDEEMTTYYDLREANRRVDSFSDQVVAKFASVNPKRQQIMKVVQEQGFQID